jgi:hypothetical protein
LAAALDRLLAQALASIIKEKLGEKMCAKIEARLQERYNLSLVDSIKDFYTLDATLREFFGAGADGIEDDFKNKLISFSTSTKGRQWITIENKELAQLILESYGDRDKRVILETAYKEPSVILDLLEKCGIPKSSGYRLVNQLVEDGLLTEEGYAEAADGKRVSKYTSLFEKTQIEIDATKGLVVRVLLKENILNESQIVRILLRGAAIPERSK